MGKALTTLLKNLGEVPEGKFAPEYYTPRFARTYAFGVYSYPLGILTHALFLFIFTLIGVKWLALFNIFSVILWTTAYWIHLNGHFLKAYILVTFEIIAHAALCVAILGWDAGFQFYVLIQPAVAFLSHLLLAKKIIFAVIYSLSYAVMHYYIRPITPQINLNPIYITLFYYYNYFSISCILSVLSFVFYRATIRAEEKLEHQKARTKAALIDRNSVLVKLNAELIEAADYVKRILPQPITAGAIRTNWRFMPSTSLGGDAFGYHNVDEDHFAVYLIDVSGHGVGAALLSASVINVLRSQSLPNTDFNDPGRVLQALNLAFPSDANKDMFFSIWYGVYDKNCRELTYASAGHPPAILCGDAPYCECNIRLLKTPNFVVGGAEESTYVKDKCTVPESNTLYIFSDGVYEVEKADGSTWRFGEFVNFIKKVKADSQSVLDLLYEYVRRIGKSNSFEDDFTIVEVVFG